MGGRFYMSYQGHFCVLYQENLYMLYQGHKCKRFYMWYQGYKYNSPASDWIFIQIFAERKIMVLNGSLGSEEWYFTRYRALFWCSSPHIVGWLKKIDDFIAVRIQSSAEHNGRNFHWIQKIFFSTDFSRCELFKNHHFYPKILLENGQKRDLQKIFYFFR